MGGDEQPNSTKKFMENVLENCLEEEYFKIGIRINLLKNKLSIFVLQNKRDLSKTFLIRIIKRIFDFFLNNPEFQVKDKRYITGCWFSINIPDPDTGKFYYKPLSQEYFFELKKLILFHQKPLKLRLEIYSGPGTKDVYQDVIQAVNELKSKEV
ncbi:MAG TPA: hypothetical protein PKJ42_09005 [Candidatus Goldiibacteriota bacterium]|nr:hypothetical protein [Candidatus Goldiibacteriota bacterium]